MNARIIMRHALIWLAAFALLRAAPASAEVVLVEGGVSRAPIVVFEDAPPFIRRAADELAEYIERTSGARPEVVHGRPAPVPESAVWVGYQPVLDALFPEVDFDFQHPEEILIAASARHLVIAGRDRWDPDRLVVEGRNWTIEGKQDEYGTVNAVYTFLHDHLGVRWLWPGETGVDVLSKDTIAFSPFEYRYHPQIRQRATVFRFSDLGDSRGVSHDWTRLQRLQLDSVVGATGGHAFTTWWERFKDTHPEYFALQPDGTRSGFPDARTVKVCQSNPAVWDQWLADAVEAIEANPSLNFIAASPNDSHSRGICVCENCMAWDHPDGQPWRYSWEGSSREYVAMTDRYITFWNQLARKLKERYPDRDDLFVRVGAYGPSTPPAVEAQLAENTVMAFVGHFPFTSESARQQQKAQWQEWADRAPNMHYRPNLWYWSGGLWGLPEVAMTKTIEDFAFLAETGCIGLAVDTTWEHWATQAPQYYLMAQLAWDPLQDGHAVLDDYYRRGFGPAAEEIEHYWHLMETARDAVVDSPDFRTGSRHRFNLVEVMGTVYTKEFLDDADALLARAEAKLENAPEIYRKRVEFVRAGYEFTRLMMSNIPLMARVRETRGEDAEAVRRVAESWRLIEQISDEAGPHAIQYQRVIARMRGGYMGGVQDYLGPPSQEFLDAAGIGR